MPPSSTSPATGKCTPPLNSSSSTHVAFCATLAILPLSSSSALRTCSTHRLVLCQNCNFEIHNWDKGNGSSASAFEILILAFFEQGAHDFEEFLHLSKRWWLCNGSILHHFPSSLPNGLRTRDNSGSGQSYYILDCIFHEMDQTYYVTDMVCWRGYSLYDYTGMHITKQEIHHWHWSGRMRSAVNILLIRIAKEKFQVSNMSVETMALIATVGVCDENMPLIASGGHELYRFSDLCLAPSSLG